MLVQKRVLLTKHANSCFAETALLLNEKANRRFIF